MNVNNKSIIDLSNKNFYYNYHNSAYVLSLKNNKYYVGLSSQINKRITNHFKNRTTNWIKKYPVINVKCIINNCSKVFENDLTLYLMNIYGWQNIRGGAWTKVNMTKPPDLIRNEVFLIFDNIPNDIKKFFKKKL